jgi:hypothetical protein
VYLRRRHLRGIILTGLVAAGLLLGVVPASAKRIHGSLTLGPIVNAEAGDVTVVNGTLKVKRICGSMRQLRAVVLDPPGGYRQASPFYAQESGKTYNGTVIVPAQPGTYQVQVRAPHERTSRGLQRGNCAPMASPTVPMVVPPSV